MPPLCMEEGEIREMVAITGAAIREVTE